MTNIHLFDTVDIPPHTPPCLEDAGCHLGEHHDGDHAEVSLSGLVIHTWPHTDRHRYDFDGIVDDDGAVYVS